MYQKILVPVAFEEGRDTPKALEIAHAIAGEGAEIIGLHVIEEVPSYVAQYLPEGQMLDNKREILEALKKKLAADTDVEIRVIEGHAGHSIVEYAAEQKVDCIVIASHRPGFQDYFLGSTAARVVRHAPCSVHVVR